MSLQNSALIKEEITGVSFQFYTSDDIRKLSVKQMVEVESFDMLGGPIPGGLHDPALGPTGPSERCSTCSLDFIECPGHFGHIELAIPCYNPVCFQTIFKLLKNKCFNCHHFKHGSKVINQFTEELNLLLRGNVVAAKNLREANVLLRGYDEKKDKDTKRESKLNGKKNKEEEESDEEDEQDKFKNGVFSASEISGDKVTHFEDIRREIFREFFATFSGYATPCNNCGTFSPRLRNGDASKSKLFVMPLYEKYKKKNSETSKPTNFSSVENQSEHGTWFAPWEVLDHLKKLFNEEKEILDLLLGHLVPVSGSKGREFTKVSNVDSLFMRVFPVTPSRYRPPNFVNGRRSEHPQNSHYKGMLKANKMIRSSIEQGEGKAKYLVNSVCDLQMHVNNMYDNSKSASTTNDVANGIKQILEKKEGLFRKHMMGKRVNYAARTVISPDISLETNEMGVPQYFAKTLTFPQPVTSFNYNQLAQAVINGPDTYPGANFIEDENGHLINLAKEPMEKRVALSKTLLTNHPHAPRGVNKKVYRHLLNGDYVLANRQPTLHKPGIMGHKVKVLGKNEKTLRMHYSNCSTYNADFDGDEMNIHFPQSLLASAEIREICANNYQYLVPRNGAPLRGLIQDHILTGVLLTKRDTLFTKADFQSILYACLWSVNTKHPIVTPPPCIFKPVPLWSGKQLISAALTHLTIGRVPLNLEAPSKIPIKMWGTHGPDVTRDSLVIIRQNEMVAGILDKGHFGASSYGLVHTCYELYDPDVAGSLLTILGRMFTSYLQTRGFTCGVDDLLMKSKEEQFRALNLKMANDEGYNVAAKFGNASEYNAKESREFFGKALQSEREVARLDGMLKKALNTYTSKIIDTLIPGGQQKPFPKNNFSLMTVSGAKGSVVNFSQVSCLLGQQELEGKRVPRMVSGKTLPSFQAYDPSARAGGFVMDRFLTGVRPQDYFFHCMAGREGLIDTAVKTSRSGYLQRCLIKHLEGLSIQYDNTVRDSDGSIIQFNYGEDSLEIGKTPYLTKFPIIAENYDLFKSQFDFEKLIGQLQNDEVFDYIRQMKVDNTMDPVMSKFNPSSDLGCVSESFMNQLNKYIDTNPQKLIKTTSNRDGKITEKDFRNLMYLYYTRSMVSPGESVGLLCAQSIGEPSTQMTLNTFHLAGRGEANVTLGIPRLREIIMTASSKPSTPLMEFQINDPTNKAETEKMAKYLEILKMCDIIKDITVEESFKDTNRIYEIVIEFLPTLKKTLELHRIKKEQLTVLFKEFIKKVNAQVRKNNKIKTQDIGHGSKVRGSDLVEDDSDKIGKDDDEGNKDSNNDDNNEDTTVDKKDNKKKKSKTPSIDDDSTTAKKKLKKSQSSVYEEGEDEASEKESESEDSESEESSEKSDVESEEESTNKNITPGEDFDYSDNSLSFTVGVPSDSKKVLMLGIVETEAMKFVLKSCKGITRCFINEKQVGGKTEYSIQSEGVNLNEIFNLRDKLKINEFYTNDIYSVLHKYGVEACRQAITSEISNVFGAYGISVDKRHLILLGDYMTFEGGYRALNRIGIENNTSPFQKMSFETTFSFLSKAALMGDYDAVKSPSSRIVLGQPVKTGTGSFSIMAPLK
ncbi:RNA polymerase I, largest subunit [Dictyostelium purpureum]|uniref:DNA-directed RNA polymerase subunit n=1 Tax=Dictyostelium purpureum TaxID=5786 RepID=F1A380_DICPU|nr:RNA polymerase I, largest subunit [Dictyostelium purpureum]EGC29348.1 RNA polymerase I, largest subunit [Dictyostelium purpureum]|eukprot:XP_003294125.1 RNA polymerase I, largest subunit [Dictyostelium purpureum]